MLSVFHTHEWLVKYSKTIMDLWRRVIVFIILGVTEGLTQHSGGEGEEEDEEDAASGCLGMRKRKQNAENQSWDDGRWCSHGSEFWRWVWKSQKITSARTDEIIKKGTLENDLYVHSPDVALYVMVPVDLIIC